MKALTIRQPYAWAIAFGYKDVENRTRTTKYCGPLAIHAGKTWDSKAIDDKRVVHAALDAGSPLFVLCGHPSACPRGAIVALVDLVDAHPADGCCKPWGDDDGFHWRLDNPRLLTEPLPCKGALGLWTPPEGVEARASRPVKHGRYVA